MVLVRCSSKVPGLSRTMSFSLGRIPVARLRSSKLEPLPRKQTEGSHLDKGEILLISLTVNRRSCRERSLPAFWALLPVLVRPLPDKALMTILRARGAACPGRLAIRRKTRCGDVWGGPLPFPPSVAGALRRSTRPCGAHGAFLRHGGPHRSPPNGPAAPSAMNRAARSFGLTISEADCAIKERICSITSGVGCVVERIGSPKRRVTCVSR